MIPLIQDTVRLRSLRVSESAWRSDLLGEDYSVVSVIGDGALTGGMAYEALNNAAHLNKNFIIVLNDNNMSISENVGGMSKYLERTSLGNQIQPIEEAECTNTLLKVPVVGEAAGRQDQTGQRTASSS